MIPVLVLSLSLAGAGAGVASSGGRTAELTDEALRARVDAYLGTIDEPIAPERWRELGDAAVPLLEGALREEPLPSRRAAAVAGLAALGGDRARAAVLSAAQDEAQPVSVRAAAVRGTALLVEPRELTAALRPVLRARSPRLQAVAAEVLARGGGAEGCAAVREQARLSAPGGRRFTVALGACSRKARRP